MPDRVKPSFVIFDFLALTLSPSVYAGLADFSSRRRWKDDWI